MTMHPASFELLYQQHHIWVFNLALQYVQNSEDAEEITQDVFVKVYHSVGQFEEKSALKTWLYRIVINKSLDFLKHKSSKKRFFIFGIKSANEKEYLRASNFEHPGLLMENQEKAALLYRAINRLSEQQKTAFILSKLDGCSNKEIAEIMELSISAIESLIFRAKAALRNQLENNFEEYRKKK